MKQITTGLIFICILLLLSFGYVQGYLIEIDAPKTLVKGSPLTVTGTTSFPKDTYFDLVLYYSKYTSDEVARTRIIVDPSQMFRVDFDTKSLNKGQYKVEVHNIISDNELFVEDQLGSSSTVRRIIQITDRSDEIQMISPTTQPQDQALTISGRMRDIGDGVLTMRVFGPDQFTYGPEQLITKKAYTGNSGDFSTTVPVPVPGEYQASISDKKGYIGEYAFTVTNFTPEEIASPQISEKTILPTETPKQEKKEPIPSLPDTPVPEPTKSPFPLLGVLIGVLSVIFLMRKE